MNRKWSNQQQAIFLKKTGELLERGYTLAEAIESLTFYLPPSKKQDLANCLLELKEGYPLHHILTSLKFNNSLIGYVYFAEQHGGLAEAFQEGSTFVLKRSEDMQRIMKMFYYPAFLICITAVLFMFVDQILLPKFTSLFQSMNLKPNIFTKVIYQVGDLLPQFILMSFIMGILILLYILFIYRRKSLLARRKMMVRLPVLGSFFRLFYTHYFTIQLSYLLAAGLSVLESLQLFEKNPLQPFYSEISKEIRLKLTRGEMLESSIKNLDIFEKDLTHIVKHGLEKGKLSQELAFYSKHCVTVLEGKTERILKLVQPILYTLIATLIVSMYLAILLPMFHLLDGI